ncbi:MAG: hypothetical protein WCP46_02930 [Alphaproteobacteria bacterium]
MNLKKLKPNDLLVMPRFGVGQCKGWQTMEIDGYQYEVLSIYFYTQKLTMHLPKAKLAAFNARALASLDEVAEAFATLKTQKSSNPRNWRRFVIDCHLKINSGEFKKLAQVVKDTLPNATKTRGVHLCRTDMHNTAIALLANELMFIQNLTYDQALELLKQAINPSISTQK